MEALTPGTLMFNDVGLISLAFSPGSLERKHEGRWKAVSESRTDRDPAFTFRRLKSGNRYRVMAPEHETDYGATCLEASSPTRTVR